MYELRWIFGKSGDSIFDKVPHGFLTQKNKRKHDMQYPLVNVYITMENHHFQWVNPLFLWSCSIAMLNYQRVNHTFIGSRRKFPVENKTPGALRLETNRWPFWKEVKALL